MKINLGFTLIEITLAILMILILALLVTKGFSSQLLQTEDLKRISYLNVIANSLVDYFVKSNQFPPDQDSSPLWANLKNYFLATNVFFNLPGESGYEYFPCTDLPPFNKSISPINHFILRVKLNQPFDKSPKLYDNSYNSSTIPSGWDCSSLVNCSAADSYYCLLQ